MSLAVAVLMDPIESIHIEKDSTFAMLLEAQRRGHKLLYLTQAGLAVRDAAPWAQAAPLAVKDDPSGWFTLGEASWIDLRKVDVILARKDPPVDDQFVYDTMVLELAQNAGVLLVNDPRALRDAPQGPCTASTTKASMIIGPMQTLHPATRSSLPTTKM